MIKFDLERALAGDKVVNECGSEITGVRYFEDAANGSEKYAGFRGGYLYVYSEDELFMAHKKLSGFVNVYKGGVCGDIFTKKEHADRLHDKKRIACIDLSQFEEGHGL